jgi:hypothetical protein
VVRLASGAQAVISGKRDTTVTGAQRAGSEDLPDRDGTIAAHRHVVDFPRENRQPLTDVRDVLATMRLLEPLESPSLPAPGPAPRA